MSESNWPAAPFEIERLDKMPVAEQAVATIAHGAGFDGGDGTRSELMYGLTVDKSDPASIGDAVFQLLIRGENDIRVIARTLDVPAIQVRALVAQAKMKFAEAALEVKQDPGARRMALSYRAQEIGRIAFADAMVAIGNTKTALLKLALSAIETQAKLEGLDTQKVEVTEHKIDEKRGTITVTQRIQEDLSRFGINEDEAVNIGRVAVQQISMRLAQNLKSNEDVIDVEPEPDQ